MTTLVEARGLAAGYGGHPMVRDIDLKVDEGEIVGLFGPNGAGKTTTLLAVAGDVEQLAGDLELGGSPAKRGLVRRAKRGLCLVTEERSVFMRLTVAENLRVGRCDEKRAVELFPELLPLMKRRAGLLSGGEQQILTLARALARRPRVLLTDELSLGLAPLVVRRLMEALRAAADEDGVGIVLVEQHVREALKIIDVGHVMERGRIGLTGTADELAGRLSEIESAYLATSGRESDTP